MPLPKPLKPEKIVDLANRWRAGHITFDVEVEPANLTLVFMPLAFGALGKFSKEEVEQLAIYGDINDAAGSVNGQPMHHRIGLLLRSDLDRVVDAVTRLEQAEAAVRADLSEPASETDSRH